MATSSFFETVVLNEEETENFNRIMEEESPFKDIQPVSDEEWKKAKEEAAAWMLRQQR